ncbi:hypothetical protein ACN6MY_03610 [Peribacillus sp. B-H-3]|uniref:hypothetical protein n=1 Tax=Peribacillus sp. B-H-3 TaxID=3400420 RepID=UPI003B014DC8
MEQMTIFDFLEEEESYKDYAAQFIRTLKKLVKQEIVQYAIQWIHHNDPYIEKDGALLHVRVLTKTKYLYLRICNQKLQLNPPLRKMHGIDQAIPLEKVNDPGTAISEKLVYEDFENVIELDGLSIWNEFRNAEETREAMALYEW